MSVKATLVRFVIILRHINELASCRLHCATRLAGTVVTDHELYITRMTPCPCHLTPCITPVTRTHRWDAASTSCYTSRPFCSWNVCNCMYVISVGDTVPIIMPRTEPYGKAVAVAGGPSHFVIYNVYSSMSVCLYVCDSWLLIASVKTMISSQSQRELSCHSWQHKHRYCTALDVYVA